MLRRLTPVALAVAMLLPAAPAQAVVRTGTAPLRLDVEASCTDGPDILVTMTNAGKRRLEIWDASVRLTPVQPGPGGIGVEVFIYLTAEAARLSPGETRWFGIRLADYELPGKRLLVDVAIWLVGRHYPATIRVTTRGCGR
jgi:hypothetical protein